MYAKHANEPNELIGLWASGDLGKQIWRFARGLATQRQPHQPDSFAV